MRVRNFNVYSVQMNLQRLQIRQKGRSKQLREKKKRRKEQQMPVFCHRHKIILNIRICSIVFYMGTGFFTCTFLPCADITPERPSLEAARALDAAASAADDAADAENRQRLRRMTPLSKISVNSVHQDPKPRLRHRGPNTGLPRTRRMRAQRDGACPPQTLRRKVKQEKR